MLIAGVVFINQVVVPSTPPLFIPTPTPTRPPESYVTEAQRLEKEGKYNQSLQIYQQAIQVDPRNPAVYVTMARLQIFTGKYKEAVTNAENALVLNGNNSMAYALRGWALGLQDQYLEAESSFKKALELDPNNASAFAFRAEILALQTQAGKGSLGSLDKAVEASRSAQTLGPDLLETHRARGIVLELTANYPDAAREYEAAIALNNNIADLHVALGRNFRYLEQYDKAVEEFNRANALNPADPLPNFYISRTYAAIGEYAKAIQFADQAVKIDPKDPSLYGNLGTMFYKNRQYEESIPPLRLALRGGTTADGVQIKPLPLEYGRVAEFYYTYGLALSRLGQCGESLQISQALRQGVKNDEVAVYNADEMVKICQEVSKAGGNPALAKLVTPGSEPEPTNTSTAIVIEIGLHFVCSNVSRSSNSIAEGITLFSLDASFSKRKENSIGKRR